jgi:DNA-binding transcriptional LysR family regulator
MRGSDYAELLAFVAIAEERSFRRAATRLGLSRSALSHSIRALEERLGTRLLNRTTRSVAPTSAGQALLDRIAPAFSEISEATRATSALSERPSGTVRLNLPRLAAEVLFAGRFGRFAAKYPDVHVELVIDDEIRDIVAGGFDAGVRMGNMLQRDMVAVRVSPDLRLAVVGSPAYFARNPVPVSPRDLENHDCINYRWTGSGTTYRWPLIKGGETLNVAVEGPVTLNDSGLVVSAALDGAGLASTLEVFAAPHIAQGRLVRVLEDWCPPLPGLFLYYPSRRQMPPALRALVEFLRAKE